MSITDVAAALIWNKQKVLIARRAPGQKHAGWWEFPGGKIEIGETGESALSRELKEELCIDASIGARVAVSEFEYDTGTVLLTAYHVQTFSGKIQMTVHDSIVFSAPGELIQYRLLPADRPIAELLIRDYADPRSPDRKFPDTEVNYRTNEQMF